MSSSKGDLGRKRAQKHQNRTVFKNDLHDTSAKTKFINSIQAHGVCARCKDIIDWKIKYKKYKPLTALKKCVRCEQKCIKHAYHVACLPCARKEGICAKCCQRIEVIENSEPTQAEDSEMQQIIKALPERKRRTLLRYLKKKKNSGKNKKDAEGNDDDNSDTAENDTKLDEKINKLKLDGSKKALEGDSDFSDDFSDDYESDDSGSIID